MKKQYINRIIISIVSRLVEYNVNALIIMTNISTAQQVGLKTFFSGVDLI